MNCCIFQSDVLYYSCSRFTETISGQFNGHTHTDEFFLFYDEPNSTETIQVAYNGASLATFVENNPSYKIYDINTNNYVRKEQKGTFGALYH